MPAAPTPIVSKSFYRTFIAFMFAAGMVVWGTMFILVILDLKELGNIRLGVDSTDITWASWSAGILYGCVLISLYWIYGECFTKKNLLPTNMVTLLLDFVALSFMAGAAAAWMRKDAFVVLAPIAMVLFSIRLVPAVRMELEEIRHKGLDRFAGALMTHLAIVAVLCGPAGGLCLLVSNYVSSDPVKTMNVAYAVVQVLMGLGVLVTIVHSFRYRPSVEMEQPVHSLGDAPRSVLIPAYSAVSDDDLRRLRMVSDNVFRGEYDFRRMLHYVNKGHRIPYSYHTACVHTYGDVEVQAFIMAGHANDPTEIRLRSMWVYLAHWFDDVFDGAMAKELAHMNFSPGFNIREVLRDLDGRCGELWQIAIEKTTEISAHVGWNRELFDLGIQRLMLSAPMFSASCRDSHEQCMDTHRSLVNRNLINERGIRTLVDEITDRHLAYTSKVVGEILDSFGSDTNFNLCLLTDLVLAPGALYHDCDAECDDDQCLKAAVDQPQELQSTLDKTFKAIEALSPREAKLVVRTFPMFVRSFAGVLEARGLLSTYEDFLNGREGKKEPLTA